MLEDEGQTELFPIIPQGAEGPTGTVAEAWAVQLLASVTVTVKVVVLPGEFVILFVVFTGLVFHE